MRISAQIKSSKDSDTHDAVNAELTPPVYTWDECPLIYSSVDIFVVLREGSREGGLLFLF